MTGLAHRSHPTPTTPPGVVGVATDGAPADLEAVDDEGLGGWWEDAVASLDGDDDWPDGHFGAAPLGIP